MSANSNVLTTYALANMTRLPFLQEPDIGLGIALRTFYDDDDVADSKETRASRLADFPRIYVPFALNLVDDFRACTDLVSALNQGVQTLDSKEVSVEDKAAWARAQAYLDARPF